MSLNSTPLSTPASQSSSRSRAAGQGNGSSTSRQLRSSTRGNDTGPAAGIHPTPPSTQDTSHLSQAAQRETAENIQTTLDDLNPNPNPPNIDINTVLRALTAAIESHRGPGPTNITNTIAASSTSTAAELPGNDPMILSIQDMFPAIDTAVIQSIYTKRFRAENLLKLEASFTYKKKRPQFYSFGAGDTSLNIATTSKDVELKEYESISHLMRPFPVYMAMIVTFAPPPQKLPLAFALMSYQHTLCDLLRTHTWDSLRKFHVVFHQRRICLGVYEPVGWSTRDHGLETAQLFKRNATDSRERLVERQHTSSPPRGPTANRLNTSSGDEICNNFNKETCNFQACRYPHVCTTCEGIHPVTKCTQKRKTEATPLSQRISLRQ
ncbi:hypothetical protein BDD12DRAFT_885480 [Trichophaea hybrida]|nr:hypothetical protein BDD12DRAFT_885480 [Trichophaea hybrida]